jgi:hypothetical protein
MDFDAFLVRPRRRLVPRAAEEVYAMTARNQSGKDFAEMKLGPASLRILVVLPVQYEYAH